MQTLMSWRSPTDSMGQQFHYAGDEAEALSEIQLTTTEIVIGLIEIAFEWVVTSQTTFGIDASRKRTARVGFYFRRCYSSV